MFKKGDQVVIRRKVNRSGPTTNEVLIGEILQFSGTEAQVSVPKRGGIAQKVTVPTDTLASVQEVFGRTKVVSNPIQRQIGLRPV